MRTSMTLLAAAAMLLALSGSANAGYWEVTYDLTGSTSTTTQPLGSASDPVTGKWRIRYFGPEAGPHTSVALVAGSEDTDIDQNFPAFLKLTGGTKIKLLPPSGGTTLTDTGTGKISPFTVVDSDATGANHCSNNLSGTWCTAIGFTASIPQPLTPTGPGPHAAPRPQLTFPSGTVGVGGFGVATPVTQTASGGLVSIKTTYVGTELVRYYVSGAVPALSGGATLGLAAVLLVGGASTLALRNRRG